MELHFLGTGSSYPSPKRCASCTIFRHEQGLWMFDCGEGTQIQFQKSTLKPGQLKKIFITHLHGDHLFGLPGLMCTIGQNNSVSEKHVDIYGPVGLRNFLRSSLRFSYSNLPYTFSVHELVLTSDKEFYQTLQIPFDEEFWQNLSKDVTDLPEHPNEIKGRQIHINEDGYYDVCKDDSLHVTAAILKHTIPCVGYVVQEDDLPGRLDISILKAKKVPAGPLYGKIKNGESIQLENGEIITPQDCVGPKRKGRKIIILGDTYNSDYIAAIGNKPDVLVHEATNEVADEVKAVEHGHSSSGMAGSFGKEIGARQLVLTHFSQRYRSMNDAENTDDVTVERLLEEAKLTFQSPNVIAADDLTIVPIPIPK